MFNVLIRSYEQLYYRLYIIIGRVDTGTDHHITAGILCSCVKVLILLWIHLVGRYCEYWSTLNLNIPDEVVFFTAVSVGVINILFFIKNNRYKRIIKRYSAPKYRLSNKVIDTFLALLILSFVWFSLVFDWKTMVSDFVYLHDIVRLAMY